LPPQAVIKAAATTSNPRSTKTLFSDIAKFSLLIGFVQGAVLFLTEGTSLQIVCIV
jgi:hypothetical protein